MDYIPIVSSAATFTLRFPLAAGGERQTDDILNAGTRIQRFWLAATRLGLALQPVMAILVFADYGQRGLPFTANQAVAPKHNDWPNNFTKSSRRRRQTSSSWVGLESLCPGWVSAARFVNQ